MFKDKMVLVTGGNRNTGLWIVKKFVDEGARVFMCGSSAASTAAGMEKLKAMGVGGVTAQACDVGDRTQVAALMDLIDCEAGTLDILVNNAADQGLGLGGRWRWNLTRSSRSWGRTCAADSRSRRRRRNAFS